MRNLIAALAQAYVNNVVKKKVHDKAQKQNQAATIAAAQAKRDRKNQRNLKNKGEVQ